MYLALESGLPSFPSGSTCPMVLGNLCHSALRVIHLQGYHLLWRAVPGPSISRKHETTGSCPRPHKPHNPLRATRMRYHTLKVWALARSLAATRAISVDFFSAGTEMFHFAAFCVPDLWIGSGIPRDESRRVAPFGDLRINARLRLPEAFRSLPRPSSPVETEASTVQLLVA